ncbi:hypothetical protein MNB_SV-14-1041 [hydrothermal vent metagenome]|uniref:Uncharacterized protein n=1 Tax=hydrothermal vent metagenome TaxID=652676 RepID=A0A1W1CD13_9ZZZZ
MSKIFIKRLNLVVEADEYLNSLDEKTMFTEFKKECRNGGVECYECSNPVSPMKKHKSDGYAIRHHRNKKNDCEAFGEAVYTVGQARANIYFGEGTKHEEIKNHIANLLPKHGFEDVKSEAYIYNESEKYENGARKRVKPDISAVKNGLNYAFEVQLSYQLDVDFMRKESFYEKTNTFAIWFFYSLDREDFKESDKMIFWNSGENAFIITDETMKKSKEDGVLSFWCYYNEYLYDLKTGKIKTVNRKKIITIDALNQKITDSNNYSLHFLDYQKAINRKKDFINSFISTDEELYVREWTLPINRIIKQIGNFQIEIAMAKNGYYFFTTGGSPIDFFKSMKGLSSYIYDNYIISTGAI